MTDTFIPLTIERMPDGGFVVSEARIGDPSRYCGPLFASTSIGEALSFIAGRLDPKPSGPKDIHGNAITIEQMDAQMGYKPRPCPNCGIIGKPHYCAASQCPNRSDWAGA